MSTESLRNTSVPSPISPAFWFGVITIMPEMFSALTQFGVTGRAIDRGIVGVETIQLRDFSDNNYRRVDERPFGGGPGMVIMAEPLSKAIQFAQTQARQLGLSCVPVVYMSPQGKTLNEHMVQQWLTKPMCTKQQLKSSYLIPVCLFDESGNNSVNIDDITVDVKPMPMQGAIVICGRYEGIDERIIERYIDLEVSIGDYVLSGGELPAMVLMDTLIRRVPKVMQDEQSAIQDSFVDGLLDCPQYTKPDVFEGLQVPDVLKSGHHLKIDEWRFVQKFKRTLQRRPELVDNTSLSTQQQKWLKSAGFVFTDFNKIVKTKP